MLQNREQAISDFLSRIADEISISEAMQKKAVSSYEAVGRYLDEGIDCKVSIMPQGSMNLGTTIRSLTDDDDGYDIDLVCLLETSNLSLAEIKNVVGNRLKESVRYAGKIDEEGKISVSLFPLAHAHRLCDYRRASRTYHKADSAEDYRQGHYQVKRREGGFADEIGNEKSVNNAVY